LNWVSAPVLVKGESSESEFST